MRRASPFVTAALAFLLCLAAPLRAPSTDTAPGVFGAIVLACHGDFDLGRIAALDARARSGRGVPYWAMLSADRRHLVSTFGPAPAVLGRPALVGVQPGTQLESATLIARIRFMCAAAVALSAALLCVALLAFAAWPVAVLGALTAVASFAGAAVFGQALWQQTCALPFLCGALAAAFWASRSRPARLVAPACAVVAALVRPVDAPLCAAIVAMWILQTRGLSRLGALGIAVAASAPLLAWNLHYLGVPLPIGQWTRNADMAERVFDLAPRRIALALAGLLVSPARGLVIFAPVALVGVVAALRSKDNELRVLAVGVIAQLFVAAAFFKWWGGASFGPRLLGGATWVAIALAAAHPRRLTAATAVVTVSIGLLGLARYTPNQWELPNDTDRHPERLWRVREGALPALLGHVPDERWGAGVTFCPDGGQGQYSTGP